MAWSRGLLVLYAALFAASCHLVGDVHDRTFVPDGGCATPSDCPASECQQALCDEGVCGVTNLPSRQACSAGICDGSGSCVACLGNDDCPSGPCQSQLCVAERCINGVQDGSETDVDCGGGCAPCGSGAGCVLPGDCASGTCDGFVCAVCASQGDCEGDFYCDEGSGDRLPRKPLNAACEKNYECVEPFECKDSMVCDD
jgi:hypothetical protein